MKRIYLKFPGEVIKARYCVSSQLPGYLIVNTAVFEGKVSKLIFLGQLTQMAVDNICRQYSPVKEKAERARKHTMGDAYGVKNRR